jgi:Arc-like DNA binding dprotein
MTLDPIILVILAALIVGLIAGVVVGALALMEHPRRWTVCLRLPEDLHHRLKEAATDHGWSLKAEMINRLQASFSQPNGDQVVDAPGL